MPKPLLVTADTFCLEHEPGGQTVLQHKAGGYCLPVEGNSVPAQYSWGKYSLVFVHDFTCPDEGLSIYFLSGSTVLDFAKTTQVGLYADLESIKPLQPDVVRFSFPDQMHWRLHCHERAQLSLHLPAPTYTFWERRQLFRSWFTLRREY